jgi:hypothetical protein
VVAAVPHWLTAVVEAVKLAHVTADAVVAVVVEVAVVVVAAVSVDALFVRMHLLSH